MLDSVTTKIIPMKKITKIMIVDDHDIVREGVKTLIHAIEGLEVIGEAENGQDFLDLLQRRMPDIVMMDIKMPMMDGMEATEKALALYPDLKIIILSSFGDEDYLYSLVVKGISGFLLKSASKPNFERAIHMVSNGQQYFSPELNGLMAKKIRQFSTSELPRFTTKEFEILRLLCKGYSTEEIAERNFISKRTVEGYRTKLLQKTEMINTINLVIYAIQNKLVTVEELETRKN